MADDLPSQARPLGLLTIGRTAVDGDQTIFVELRDAQGKRLTCYVTPASFALALTGLAQQPCTFQDHFSQRQPRG